MANKIRGEKPKFKRGVKHSPSLFSITVADAARYMEKAPGWIRGGLKSGRLPFGCAILNENSNIYSFHISRARFEEYMGMTVKEMEAMLAEKEKVMAGATV